MREENMVSLLYVSGASPSFTAHLGEELPTSQRASTYSNQRVANQRTRVPGAGGGIRWIMVALVRMSLYLVCSLEHICRLRTLRPDVTVIETIAAS